MKTPVSNFRLTEKQKKTLKTVGNGNMSEGLRVMINYVTGYGAKKFKKENQA